MPEDDKKTGALFSVDEDGNRVDAWIWAELLEGDDPKQDPYYRDLAKETVERGELPPEEKGDA